MNLLSLIILNLTIVKSLSFMYTLPGDQNWPTTEQFISLRNLSSGKVILRGDNDYKPHTWNRITNVPKPAVIIQPKNTNDIIEALKFARKYNIRVSVQSTGHHQDHRNIYDNSVHFDLSTLNFKSIDLNKKLLTLGPGNNFSQIHQFVAKESNRKLITVGGADPGVGIYGWTVGGGHGALTRQFGSGVDQLVSIDLLLANYTIVSASETQNAELFRAIRGSGGGSYGIAVSLTVKLYDNPGVVSTFGALYSLTHETVSMFSKWVINIADNRTVAYFDARNFGDNNKYILLSSYCFGNTSDCTPILDPLKTGCIPNQQLQITCVPIYERFPSFYDLFATTSSDTGGVVYLSSTALSKDNILNALKEIITFLDTNQYTMCIGSMTLGGISSTLDMDREKTSVAPEFRHSEMAISCVGIMDDNSSKDIRWYQVSIMDNFAQNVLKKYCKWVFWNEPQHNFPNGDWKERYWGGMDNYNRLLKVKNETDPDGIFTCYHCIGYVKEFNEDPSVCPMDKCTCSNTDSGTCASTPNIINVSSKSKKNTFTMIISFFIFIFALVI